MKSRPIRKLAFKQQRTRNEDLKIIINYLGSSVNQVKVKEGIKQQGVQSVEINPTLRSRRYITKSTIKPNRTNRSIFRGRFPGIQSKVHRRFIRASGA